LILVSAWVMALAALRDRMALAMTFVLPAVLFLVFAAIFAGATGKDLKLKIGLIDLAHTPSTARFVAALQAETTVRIVAYEGSTEAPLVDAVARGAVDVGVALRGDLERRPEAGPPPILVVEDAARPLAATIALGQTQRILSEKLPDVTLARILADVEASGAIEREERDVLDDAFRKQASDQSGKAFSFARIAETTTINAVGGNANVLYYAGAVIAIFLLFSAAHGGLTILDERASGVAERLRLTRGGMTATIAGKFLFLCGQGVVQAGIVYLVAYLAFGASVSPDRLWLWGLTCLFASAAAAGLGLAMASVCATRKQAENATTFLVLLISAVGGSMVPRYLMPPWLQALAFATPNAWIIDAFEQSVRAGWGFENLLAPWRVLIGCAAGGLLIATVFAIRRARY
jgi:ABC-2 type transport system permease protein